MRSTPRLVLAAVALISTTAFVRAQDSAAPAPPSTVVDPPAAAASVATVDAATNPALPKAAANTAPVKSVETESPNKTGTGGWFVLGLLAVALFASITRFRSQIPKRKPIVPIENLPLDRVPVPFRLN